EVRIRPDRDGGTAPERRAGVDTEGRHEQAGRDVEVRRREAEPGAAMLPVDDGPVDLGGPSEQLRRLRHLAGREQAADVARRDVVHERYAADVESQPFEQRKVARPAAPEAEAVARRHDL